MELYKCRDGMRTYGVQTLLFDSLPSTQRYARENVSQFNVSVVTRVVAYSQTEGEGCGGRVWVAPHNSENLFLSLYISDVVMKIEPLYLIGAMGRGFIKLLSENKIEGTMRFPNDVIVNGKKIAGILCDRLQNASILGIGANINAPDDTLRNVGQPATSIYVEARKKMDISYTVDMCTKYFLDECK